ncbi:acyltransferase [Sporomusa sp.]|uniref:acyltransferase n=1 Tax=Sporomusa sp. TaxID=2078658 RepID=UPI002C93A638|nr:acyltransferase [Sporomusa sp.]HWR45843.1 acyltransferase [Sporomusa sp.]
MPIFDPNRIKKWLLQASYKGLFFDGDVRILGALPYIKMYEHSQCRIGKNAVINSDFAWSNTALAYRCKFVMGYDGLIEIGDNTQLNGVSITAYKRISIGKNCQIASATFIADTDFHPVDPVERRKQVMGQRYSFDKVAKKEVIIGDNVWIGWGSILLKGVEIGSNSIVAAGSVVLSQFPENVIIAGNPAKIVKRI